MLNDTRQEQIKRTATELIQSKQCRTQRGHFFQSNISPDLSIIDEDEHQLFAYELATQVIDYIKKNCLQSPLKQNQMVLTVGGALIAISILSSVLFYYQKKDTEDKAADSIDGTLIFAGLGILTILSLILYFSCHKLYEDLEEKVSEHSNPTPPTHIASTIHELMRMFDLQPTKEDPKKNTIRLFNYCNRLVKHYQPTVSPSEERQPLYPNDRSLNIDSIWDAITQGSDPTDNAFSV